MNIINPTRDLKQRVTFKATIPGIEQNLSAESATGCQPKRVIPLERCVFQQATFEYHQPKVIRGTRLDKADLVDFV